MSNEPAHEIDGEQTGIDTAGKHGQRNQSSNRDEWELVANDDEALLSVRNLHTEFDTNEGIVQAVNGVSFEVNEGEIVGLVGESGSGKSVTSLSLMGLIQPPGYIRDGTVMFDGENLLEKSNKELRGLRGNRMSMIFQEPMSALNPVYDIGWQVGEPLRIHQDIQKGASRRRAAELMREVGIPSAEERIDDFPHQFSGGMRQRAMIAMALACEPDLLIADEPTTSLDVTIEAKILDLIQKLNEERGMAVFLVTHNLGVVAEVCDKVAVMYAGRIVEYAPVEDIFDDPRHPYTQALIDCVPDPTNVGQRLEPIEGQVPDLTALPDGCHFANRCEFAVEDCTAIDPRLQEVSPDHFSACIWEDPQ